MVADTMPSGAQLDTAVARLHELQIRIKTDSLDLPVEPSLTAKEEVLARFQPLFSADHLPLLTEEEFRSFLIFRNNRHWSGLQRLGPGICADMGRLREGLAVLLDPSRPIVERYDYAISHVPHMGRAVATAILHVADPDHYGVWNSTSEAGLKALDLWPRFDRSEKEGRRYQTINATLVRLAQALSIDLWVLDALWYYLLAFQEMSEPADEDALEVLEELTEAALSLPSDVPPTQPLSSSRQRFGLERHLHEFLRDNWDQTELGREWALYREPGNELAGYEYPCGVGRIDLLAHHRYAGTWLVVELKRNQSGDQTLGQVMRYMGWVKRHLAEANEEVRGLIIAHDADDALVYAVSMAPAVDLLLYQVQFHLTPAPEPAV